VPQLAPELIDQINAANDIVEVVSGYFPLKRTGAVWKAICPFHDERTPSLRSIRSGRSLNVLVAGLAEGRSALS
jgi:hypothetical protein